MKYSNLFLCILICIVPCFAIGQSKKFESIKRINLNHVRAIKEKGEVMGYLAFYFVEKQDRKNSNYLLEILDLNLTTTQQILMTQPKADYFLEGQYNGSHFCFTFLDNEEKSMRSEIYNQNGEKVGSYQTPPLDKSIFDVLRAAAINEDVDYSGTLIPIENLGFGIISLQDESGQKYQMDAFSNTGAKLWSNNSGNRSKAFEILGVLNTSEDFIVASLSTRPSLYSQDLTDIIVVLDSKTGKRVFELEWSDKDVYPIISGVDYIKSDGEFLMFGEVYGKKNGKIDIKNKIGFFVRSFDLSGKLISKRTFLWKEDIGSVISLSDKGKFADGISVMIHRMIKTNDGRYFAIGEQFNKEVSVGGMAGRAIGAGTSAAKIALYNFMIFEFDADLKLLNIEVVVENKTNLLLPAGYGLVSEEKLGYLIKSAGWFNYDFTTVNSDRSNFSTAYSVYNKGSDNKDNRYTVGVITLDSDKKVKTTRLDLKSKPTAFVALETRPGYVAIFEYFKKEKMAQIRLEKLDI